MNNEYDIILPFQNDKKRFLRITLEKVNNPQKIPFNTLPDDYPILKDHNEIRTHIVKSIKVHISE